jgi:hypothetical protein
MNFSDLNSILKKKSTFFYYCFQYFLRHMAISARLAPFINMDSTPLMKNFINANGPLTKIAIPYSGHVA